MQPNKDFIENNVREYLRQTVFEKYKGQGKQDGFINQETNTIYNHFENRLINNFKSLIPEQQKTELEKLISHHASQEEILSFFMDSIENFELEIIKFLSDFRKEYLGSK